MTAQFCSISLDNYRAAYSIHQGSHLFPWSEKVFADCLTPPYFGIYIHDGKPIGYAIGMQVLDEVTLMDVAIQPEARGKSWGTQLLKQFVHVSKSSKAAKIWLEVRASNIAAIHLYKRFGFEVVETRLNYYQSPNGKEDALIMVLDIQ
jgi:ribosomal-protein-alanine N-acetyltransferase